MQDPTPSDSDVTLSESSIKKLEAYQKFKKFITEHPVYGGLTEEEIDEISFSLSEKHVSDKLEVLDEFVDMYMLPTAGFGPNSGSSLAYSNPSMGHSNSGVRPQSSRQGTRVYGYGSINGIIPGDGYAPIGDDVNIEPELVVVPDKESNYKPWMTELTADGDRRFDIERNQVSSEKVDEWMGPLGEVARALEAYGYDLGDIVDMTQEEIEDLLLKLVKKEKSEDALFESKNIILTDKKQSKNIILESFLTEDDLIEAAKKHSRIQMARDILASKHQQKKATEKEKNGRSYVLDQYDIERMMTKYGYVFKYESESWEKKQPKKKEIPDQPISKDASGAADENANLATDKSSEKNAAEVEPVDKNSDIESNTDKKDKPKEKTDPNPFHDGSFIQKMKEYQARFILSLAHDINTATETQETNDKEGKIVKTLVVPKEEIIREVENKQYSWNSEKMMWVDVNLTLPDKIFESGDTIQSVTGRSILTALTDGQFHYISIDSTGVPTIESTKVNSEVENKGFHWNAEIIKWEFVPKEKLNEATNPKAWSYNPNDSKGKFNIEKEYGYNPTDVEEMSGRYALRGWQLKKLKDLADSGAPQSDIDNYKDSIKDDKDPTFFKSYNIDHPLMDYDAVETDLTSNGFKLIKKNKIQYWSDTSDVPSALADVGETEESFIGRSVLAAKNRKTGGKYLAFKSDINKKGDTYKPLVQSRLISSSLDGSGYVWNAKSGWITRSQVGIGDQGDYDADLPEASIDYFQNENSILRKHQNSDWEMMSWSDKAQYKKSIENAYARRVLGIQSEDWPVGDDLASKRKRQYYRNKMGIKYRFDKNTKQMVPREKPLPMKGDYVSMKGAIGSLGRLVGKTGILGAGLLSMALKGIWGATKLAAELQPGHNPDVAKHVDQSVSGAIGNLKNKISSGVNQLKK